MVNEHTDDENYTLYGDFDTYQEKVSETAIYPAEYEMVYPLLGLMGEVGEFCNKYKKVLRDDAEFPEKDIVSELGDILWYLAQTANDFGIEFSDVAYRNIKKLQDRKNRGVLGGSGDTR